MLLAVGSHSCIVERITLGRIPQGLNPAFDNVHMNTMRG